MYVYGMYGMCVVYVKSIRANVKRKERKEKRKRDREAQTRWNWEIK
jgi:hypothetical protein